MSSAMPNSARKAWRARALLLTCLSSASLRAAASAAAEPLPLERVDVEVVEIAGGRAYLAPRVASPVKVGDRVRISGQRLTVLATNGKHLMTGPGAPPLVRGARGVVIVRVQQTPTFAERPPPRPLTAFTDQWSVAPLPAESQRPRFVPLGVLADERRNRAAFVVDYERIQPLSGPAYGIGRTRLRALLHAELDDIPLRLDADGTAEFWQAGDLLSRTGNASRPALIVRQLELGYRGERLQGAVGRLRYASRTLGTLDGARVAASLGDSWSLAAFGGALADPLDGSVAMDAARFGAELEWHDDVAASRPRASLTAQASRFQGQIDERRLTGILESFPGPARLAARAELSLFDQDNPWGSDPVELSAAGVDASIRFDSLRLGAALDMRRPERSLWLAEYLPQGYFCVTRAEPGAVTEPCIGSERRYFAALNAGWQAPLWSLDGGVSFATTEGVEADQTSAFVSARRRELFGPVRVEGGASATRGSLIESVALNVGAGTPLLDEAADMALFYRPSLLRYRADRERLVEHGVGTRFWWAPRLDLDLSGSAEIITGGDVDVLLLQVGAAYRPRF
jgi:hypothetical protein